MFKIKEENKQQFYATMMVASAVGCVALAWGYMAGHAAAMNSVRQLVIASALVDAATEAVPTMVMAA